MTNPPCAREGCGHAYRGHVVNGYCLAGHGCVCPAYVEDAPAPAPSGEKYDRESEFAEKLRVAINQCSQENGSNTPDFILTAYLVACLDAFNKASREREAWYGKSLHI